MRREGRLFGAAVVVDSTTGERRRRDALRGGGATATEGKEALNDRGQHLCELLGRRRDVQLPHAEQHRRQH